MSRWRERTRRVLPYVVVAAIGFLAAWLVLFFFVFPQSMVASRVTVPAVIGLDTDAARRKLVNGGLTMVVGTSEVTPRTAAGIVLRQRPAAESEEERGTAVTVDVSAGMRAP